jgi:hypothetical protein
LDQASRFPELESSFLASAREVFPRAELGISSGITCVVETLDLEGSFPLTELVVKLSFFDPSLPTSSLGWRWRLWDEDEAFEDQVGDLDPRLAVMNLVEDLDMYRSGQISASQLRRDRTGRVWILSDSDDASATDS